MHLTSVSFDFIDEDELGSELHWLRARRQECIDVCAQKLGVAIDVIDKIESGQFDDPRIDLELLARYVSHYDETLHISLRCGNEY